jgi:hypothetical protein
VTPDLNGNVPDLVVLLLKWRLDDDSLVQDDVATYENFGKVSPENNFLL